MKENEGEKEYLQFSQGYPKEGVQSRIFTGGGGVDRGYFFKKIKDREQISG